MARKNTILDVFVASPGDIIDERESIEVVIGQLNALHSRTNNITLNLLDWERSTHPDAGNYPQEIINEQIGEYDIFIGLLWNKFGTRTPNAPSGTKEEFDKAMERYENGEKIKVLVYLSTINVNPEDIDCVQLENVRNFKKLMLNGEKSKNLCYEYNSIEKFQNKLRNDLSHIILNYDSNERDEKLDNDEVESEEDFRETPKNEIKIDENNLGVIDNIENANKNFEIATELLFDITKDIENLGNDVNKRVENMNNNDIASVKLAINLVSEDMDSFSEKLNRKRPKLYNAFTEGINNVLNVASVINKFEMSENNDVDKSSSDMITEVKNLKTQIPFSIEGISEFKSTVEELPPMTNKFNRSKKNIIISINNFVNDMQNMIKSIEEFENQVD